MALRDIYRGQVALLMRVLPLVASEPSFALKGGTAINLFFRDLPRLSVDIDLTYLPVEDRTTSLAAIDTAIRRLAASIERAIPGATATLSILRPENIADKIIVRTTDKVQIKIEVTPVLRGCVYPPELRSVMPAVETEYGFAEVQTVSFADLYAGKIVAALDRQHPRDLFDVRDLLANEGISEELRRAFLIYVLSHPRPMSEILAPRRKPLAEEFARGFEGMTTEPVPMADLEEAREAIIAGMIGDMPEEHRRFLVSVKQGAPDWSLLGIPDAKALPAIQWKLQNLAKLDPARRSELVALLEAALWPEN